MNQGVFDLPTWLLAVLLLALIVGSAMGGLRVGRSFRVKEETGRETFGVLQAALIGFMGLILAFGLSLAVGRYEARRAAVVDDANTIGTAYLRAQTLPEPQRGLSLPLLVQYTDVEIRLSHVIPGSAAAGRTNAAASAIERPLWKYAAQAVEDQPTATAPRLYEESLNDMFDQQTVRAAGLTNRVPAEVLIVEIIGAALTMSLLGLHIGILGRGMVPLLLAAIMVTMLVYTIIDLDRPTRGLIQVPDTPLTQLRTSMALPAAAGN